MLFFTTKFSSCNIISL